MPQKYKVFFNDYLLMITHPGDCVKEFFHEEIEELNPEWIHRLVEEFEDSRINTYGICYRDPDALFDLFCENFRIIHAAGGVVRDRLGRFLFIKRFNRWDLPKGKAEVGETPEITALREVEEECQIDQLSILSALPDTYHTYWIKDQRVLKKTHWFAMDYQGDREPQPQTEEGITDTIWLPPSLFDQVIENTYRSLATLINDIDWKKFT